MSRKQSSRLPYGTRGRLRDLPSAARQLAPTFGKEKLLTHSVKAAGQCAVEVDAERLVAQMFKIDPDVSEFKAQPFIVDLIEHRICRSDADVKEARARHKGRKGPKFYFPDFEASRSRAGRVVTEVKLEGYLGGEEYTERLSRAQAILDGHGYQFMRLIVPRNAKHPLRTNLALLATAQLRKDLWPNPERAAAIGEACGGEGMTVVELCELLGESADLVPVWIVSGALRADLFRCAINGFLRLFPAHGSLDHLSLFEGLAK